MPIQYLYPSGDLLKVNFYNELGTQANLYRSVDEGVSTAIDTDYNLGTIPHTILGGGPCVDYLTIPVNVIPNDVNGAWMNLRCKVGGSGVRFEAMTYGYYGVDMSGKPFSALGIPEYTINNNPSYTNLQIPLKSLSDSGNVGNTFFGDIVGAIYLNSVRTLASDFDATITISAIEIVLSGDNVRFPAGSTDLYISGPILASGGINNPTLYINGVIPTGLTDSMPLYLLGSDVSNSGVDLYIHSMSSKNSCDLFIEGHSPFSGNIDLFIEGGFPSGIIPMYISGLTPNNTSGNTDLFIYASTDSGVYNAIPLYTMNSGLTANLPLFLQCQDSGPESQSLPLFVKAEGELAGYVPLYLANNNVELNSTVQFRTKGAGQNEGWNLASDSIPLFIARPTETSENIVPLFVQSPSGSFEGLDMYISGGTLSNNSVDLAMPDVLGQTTKIVTLRTHGF